MHEFFLRNLARTGEANWDLYIETQNAIQQARKAVATVGKRKDLKIVKLKVRRNCVKAEAA